MYHCCHKGNSNKAEKKIGGRTPELFDPVLPVAATPQAALGFKVNSKFQQQLMHKISSPESKGLQGPLFPALNCISAIRVKKFPKSGYKKKQSHFSQKATS
jgi:hypothetical protein